MQSGTTSILVTNTCVHTQEPLYIHTANNILFWRFVYWIACHMANFSAWKIEEYDTFGIVSYAEGYSASDIGMYIRRKNIGVKESWHLSEKMLQDLRTYVRKVHVCYQFDQ